MISLISGVITAKELDSLFCGTDVIDVEEVIRLKENG